jgi:hypothetical protein
MARPLRITYPGAFYHVTSRGNESERESDWTESIAVGGKSFVDKVKKHLGFKAKGRTIKNKKNYCQLRENIADFGSTSFQGLEPDAGSNAGMDNTFFWNNKS